MTNSTSTQPTRQFRRPAARQVVADAPQGSPATNTTSVPAPPKYRRRPLVLVLAIVAVCLGALLGAWAWTTGTTQTEVVALRNNVQRGAIIQAADLQRVRLGGEQSLKTVPGANLASLVGKRAGQDMQAGSLVNPAAVSDAVVPGNGTSMVGLELSPAQMPAVKLQNGDHVRIVATQGKTGATGTTSTATGSAPATPIVISATVDSVSQTGDSKAGTTQATIVNVIVAEGSAADLASKASSGNIALVLDSRER